MKASSYKRADFFTIDFLNIVSTQALLLQSENDLVDSDTRVVVNLVNLYRALGEDERSPMSPTVRNP